MNLLLADGAAGAQKGGSYITIIMMVAIFAIFYFLLIRPQQKRQKELQRQIQGVQKGDKIVTAGGVKGNVLDVKEETVMVDSKGTQLEVMKPYIAQVIKK